MKIKEGGVMDLQKEREAFLKWHYQMYLLENPEIDTQNAQYIYDYAHKNALCAQLRESHFTVWQAAKAQSDKKIKLLLCDEHLQKCESPTGVFNSQYPDEEPCLICLAKEAKAQAVPEGFVLVEKKLIKTLHEELLDHDPDSFVVSRDICELWKQAQEPVND